MDKRVVPQIHTERTNVTTPPCAPDQYCILPGEDPAAYQALRQRWFNEYGGDDENDAALIERVAQAEWRLLRYERNLSRTEDYINAAKPLWDWTPDDHKLMAAALRYRNQALRVYKDARRDIDGLRINRQREITAICTAGRNMDDHVLRNPGPVNEDQESEPESAITTTRTTGVARQNRLAQPIRKQ